MPREGAITGSVDLIPRDGRMKLRVTIWSGPDFRTPTITRGAWFEDEVAARHTADKAVEAMELLGIPVEGTSPGHESAEPLLFEAVEHSDYPVVRD